MVTPQKAAWDSQILGQDLLCFVLLLNLIFNSPLGLPNGSNMNTVKAEIGTPLILGARYKDLTIPLVIGSYEKAINVFGKATLMQ